MIRLEPFREPGSAPAKPLGSLGSLSGPRVAAGLVVGRPQSPTTTRHARQADRRRFETSECPATFETSSYEAMSSSAAATTASGVIPSSRAITGAGAEAP